MEWRTDDFRKESSQGSNKLDQNHGPHTGRTSPMTTQQRIGNNITSRQSPQEDEWGAMMRVMAAKHQTQEKLRQEEIKRQRQEYQEFLEMQRLEKTQQKMQEKTLIKHESEVITEKHKVLQQLNAQKAQEDKSFQNFLKVQYQTSLNQHEIQKKETKQAEKIEEQKRLQLIQKDLEQEKQREKERRYLQKEQMKSALQYQTLMNQIQQKQTDHSKQDWIKTCEINAQNDRERQENYKKFFKDFDTDMQRRMNQHIDHVVTQEMNKQTKLDQMEQTYEEKKRQWLEEKERQREEFKRKNVIDMYATNKQKIEEHLAKQNEARNSKVKSLAERRSDENDYRNYEQQIKDDEREKRKMYKDTLDHQLKLIELQRNKKGSMTIEERLLNMAANSDQDQDPLIPGINNIQSVGSSPLRRGAHQMLSQTRRSSAYGQILLTTDINKERSDSLAMSQSMKTFQPFKNRLKGDLTRMNEEPVDSDRYNTITNPIPWQNHNPYIAREKSMASRRFTQPQLSQV